MKHILCDHCEYRLMYELSYPCNNCKWNGSGEWNLFKEEKEKNLRSV